MDWGDALSVRPEFRTQHPQKGPGTEVCTSLLKPFLKYRFPMVDTRESLFSCVPWILGVINLRTEDYSQDPFKVDFRELCSQFPRGE